MTHTLLGKIDSLITQERPFRCTAHDLRAQTFPTVLLKGLDPAVVRTTLEQLAEDLTKSEWQGAATREALTEARRHLSQYFETKDAIVKAKEDAQREYEILVGEARRQAAEMLARAASEADLMREQAGAQLAETIAQTKRWEDAGGRALRFLQVTLRDMTTVLDAAEESYPALDFPEDVLPTAVISHGHGAFAGPSSRIAFAAASVVRPDAGAMREAEATQGSSEFTPAEPTRIEDVPEWAAALKHLDAREVTEGTDSRADVPATSEQQKAPVVDEIETVAASAEETHSASDSGETEAELPWPLEPSWSEEPSLTVDIEITDAGDQESAEESVGAYDDDAFEGAIASADSHAQHDLVTSTFEPEATSELAYASYALPATPAHWPIGQCTVPQIGLVPYAL